MALAQQGKWKTLLDLSMKVPLPTYEPTPEEELLDEHGLSTGNGAQSYIQLPVKDR